MIWRVLVFYLLTFFFTMLIGGLQQEAGLLPALTFLPQWGPGIAGLLTALIFRKRDGWQISWFRPELPPLRYLALLGLPLIMGLSAYGIARVFFTTIPAGPPITALLLIGMPIGAIGEEIGWRGYLQRRLAPQMTGAFSALLVGFLWTFFHIQFWAAGPVFLAVLAISFMAMSVTMQSLLADYEYNVLGAALFHLGINLGSLLIFGLLLAFDLPFLLIYTGLAVLIAVITVLTLRHRAS